MPGADRRYRLTGAGAFEAVLRAGRRRNGDYLELIALKADGECRFGMVIGRKALPRAVDRNRIRRMLRPVLHRVRPMVGGYDLIVRLKRGAPRHQFPLIVADAERLLASATRLSP